MDLPRVPKSFFPSSELSLGPLGFCLFCLYGFVLKGKLQLLGAFRSDNSHSKYVTETVVQFNTLKYMFLEIRGGHLAKVKLISCLLCSGVSLYDWRTDNLATPPDKLKLLASTLRVSLSHTQTEQKRERERERCNYCELIV